jgi:hypothetical protein
MRVPLIADDQKLARLFPRARGLIHGAEAGYELPISSGGR